MNTTNSSFIIHDDGSVKACGSNGFRQLGLGVNVNKCVPLFIPNLDNVKQVSCGTTNSKFLLNDGTVKVCGYNNLGQLGLGDGIVNVNTPTLIHNLNSVKEISSGDKHTLFLLNDGTCKACGDNSCGQLGIGNFSYCSYVPTIIPNLSILSNKFLIKNKNLFYGNDLKSSVDINNDHKFTNYFSIINEIHEFSQKIKLIKLVKPLYPINISY